MQKFDKGLPAQIRDLTERYDEIIIDAGGRDSMELRYALGVADRAYIPVQPFQFDIWTIRQMDNLIEMATSVNQNLEAFIVLNRASTNPVIKEDQETRDYILEENFGYLSLAGTIIRDRIAFRKAARGGLSVMEWSQDKKAISEITKLYEEIYGG